MRKTTAARTSASFQLMRNRNTKEPTILMEEMKRFSGPWWANSEISNRSLTSLLIIWPVLFLS